MKKTFFIIFSLLLILQSVRGLDFDEWEFESEESFLNLYNRWRSYYDVVRIPDEMEQRLNVFKDNVMYVYENMNPPYHLKLNKFADLTFQEFSSIYADCGAGAGAGYDNKEPKTATGRFMYENATELPEAIDWRKEGAVTPVKDQKSCCSCWAFSSVAAVEGISQIKTKILIPLSEQELVDCDTTKNKGCVGGFMYRAFDFISRNGGITSEKDYPYKARNETCQTPKISNATIDWYEHVEKNEASLLKAVAHQPVSVAIDANNRNYQLYTGGIYNGTCGKKLNHAMTVVGYGFDTNQTKFWIVKNSYGLDWGEKGYIMIKREIEDPEGLCGIAMAASYPTKDSLHNPSYPKDEEDIKDEL